LNKRLIINADDYGRTHDISRGIRYAHTHGLVTSSTCMMNMPGVLDDIKLAQKETPGLGLGVHLVLTAGKPLLPASKLPGLVNKQGLFLKQEELLKNADELDVEIIKTEWHAQISAFIRAAGKKPTHLDSHHHSSYFTERIMQGMLELAIEYNIPIRMPISHDTDLFDEEKSSDEKDLTVYGPRLLEKYQPKGPDGLFTTFYDENATRAELFRIFRILMPNGTFEIMSHPGYVDENFARESSYNYQRQNELEILTDPAVRKEMERHGIQLINFSEL